jgi:uncharacterized membrane protein YraQ (UPF0718 family)
MNKNDTVNSEKELKKKKENIRKKTARIIVFTVFGIAVLHTIYMNVMGFNSLSHDACVVYESVPRWFFYLYETVFELLIVVLLGVFAGVLAEQYFHKIKRFYPRNQVLAFLYAAILPLCSCGVIPLIDSMKRRTSLKVIITFIIATPLLNPYTIFISFSVLGVKYAVLRIVSSFVLAIVAGIIVDLIAKRYKLFIQGDYEACDNTCDVVTDRDIFVKTLKITKKLLPYISVAAILSFLFLIINPQQFLTDNHISFNHEPFTMIIVGLIGIPLYVCNGADVLILKPLLGFTDLTMGSAMAFSLTSSAICVASITMLTKFLGKKLTAVLVVTVFILTIVLGTLINLIP